MAHARSPASNDELPIWDATAGAMKKATVATIVSSGSQSPVLLSTLTASNSASLSDTTSLTSAFPAYEIIFENVVPATSAQVLQLLVHSGGSFQATTYVSSLINSTAGGAFAGGTSTTGLDLMSTARTNAAPGVSGKITVSNPSSTTAPKGWVGDFTGNNNTPASVRNLVNGYWNGGNGAIDGFEVLFGAGNITSGVIKIYGIP